MKTFLNLMKKFHHKWMLTKLAQSSLTRNLFPVLKISGYIVVLKNLWLYLLLQIIVLFKWSIANFTSAEKLKISLNRMEVYLSPVRTSLRSLSLRLYASLISFLVPSRMSFPVIKIYAVVWFKFSFIFVAAIKSVEPLLVQEDVGPIYNEMRFLSIVRL